jgi:hypothetical protein
VELTDCIKFKLGVFGVLTAGVLIARWRF